MGRVEAPSRICSDCSSCRRLVQRAVGDGTLSAGHAKVLLSTPDRAYQEALAKRIVAEELSVRATEQLLRERESLEDSLSH